MERFCVSLARVLPPFALENSCGRCARIDTATTCDGESRNRNDMLIIGFDTSDETTKQRSILSNLLEECMVNEWIHDNGGGMKLESLTA